LSQAYVEPTDDTERTVTEIWSELFGVEKIGRNDNFFELGGHSLLGTQAVARIRQRFGIDLPLRTVFEAPTPAELSNLLRTIPWASGSMSSSPMLDTEREEIEL
jgi:acyl carrier protein